MQSARTSWIGCLAACCLAACPLPETNDSEQGSTSTPGTIEANAAGSTASNPDPSNPAGGNAAPSGGGSSGSSGATGSTGATGTSGTPAASAGIFGLDALAAFDALSAEQRAAVQARDVLFHHHSVGENIMGLWTDDAQSGGAAALGFDFPSAASPSAFDSIGLGRISGGSNGNAASKLTSLEQIIIDQHFGTAVSAVVFKLCYIDFGSGSTLQSLSDVEALKADYRASVARMRAAYPALSFVHITPPLRNYWNSNGNDLRVAFGAFLRDEYGAVDSVVDLQDIVSHDAAGSLCARQGVPVMCDDYVGGTGHLTALGATRAAKALLYALSAF